MEVLFLVAVCCGLPVLVALVMSAPKLLVMFGMALSKKIPKRANAGDLPTNLDRGRI